MVAYPGFLTLIATLAASATQATFVDEIHQLVARQTSSSGVGIDPSLIPPQCKDICLPINDLSSGACATFDCLCGTRISSSVSGCLQCELNVSGAASLIPRIQGIYDNYASTCKAQGKTVPPFTFKFDGNQNPSGTSNSTGSSGGPTGSPGPSGGGPGSSGGSPTSSGGSPAPSGGSSGSSGGNSGSGGSSGSPNPSGGTGGGGGTSSVGGNGALQLHITAAGLACVLATALLLVA